MKKILLVLLLLLLLPISISAEEKYEFKGGILYNDGKKSYRNIWAYIRKK